MTGFAAASSWGAPILGWWRAHRTAAIVLVYAAVAGLLAIPVLVADVPLGVDTVSHLARIYVRAHIGQDPDLARIFQVKSDLIPYLGMDLLLTPLARVLPIMVVGRLYILALVWGLVGAVVVLQRTFTGRIGLGPAAAGLIAYNGLLAWGLLNYVLGLILALLAFAAWHALRERSWILRLILFTGVATAIYLTHLLAFVLYGVLVVSYEVLGRARPWRTPLRDWVVLAAQAAPGLLLWVAFGPKLSRADFFFQYGPLNDLLLNKLWALGAPFLFRGTRGGLDVGMVAACLCGAALFVGGRRGWLACPRTLVGPVAALLALTLILPIAAFGVLWIDYRFSVPAACLALAGLRLRSSAPPIIPLAVALTLFTVAHVADTAMLMRQCDGQYAELRHAFAALPRGVELTTAVERADPAPGAACIVLPIYDHISQLVTIDRSGYERDFFARDTSVAVRGGRQTDTEPAAADILTAAPPTGYLLWIHLGHRRPAPPGLILLRRGSFFDLWAARRSPAE